MNADDRPNSIDLAPISVGQQTPLLWIDRSLGLSRVFDEADRRLYAAQRLCFIAPNGVDEGDRAADLAMAVAVLIEDARSLISAHHDRAWEHERALEAYAEEISKLGAAQAKKRTGGKA